MADDPSTTVRVRVSDTGSSVEDLSDADFKIVRLNVTAPDGSVAWTISSSRNIEWDNDSAITNVLVEYSIDGGVTYNPIVESYGTSDDGIVPNSDNASSNSGNSL